MENKVEIKVEVWCQNQVEFYARVKDGEETKCLLGMRMYDVELYIFALDLYKLMQAYNINVPEPKFSVKRGLPIYGNIHFPQRYEFEYFKYRKNFEVTKIYDFDTVKHCVAIVEHEITLEQLTMIAKALIPYLNKNKVWVDCFKECMTYYDLKFISNKSIIGLEKIKYYIDTFNATTRTINKMVKLFNELPGKYNWYQKIAYDKKSKKYVEKYLI